MKIRNLYIDLIVIVLVSFGVYSNSFTNSFVYDDNQTIVENWFIKDWGNLRGLLNEDYFKGAAELSYRPVVTFTYFIDHSLWHLNPLGYHISNVAIHTINCLLLYALILIISRGRIISLSGSMIFAAHPILTEAVNAISYREDLLAAMFLLGSFILYIRSGGDGVERVRVYKRDLPKLLLYLGSLVLYFMGLLSKEMAITLPLLLIAADYALFYDPLSCATHPTSCDSRHVSRNHKQSSTGILYPVKTALSNYLGFFIVGGVYAFIRFVILKNPREEIADYARWGAIDNLVIMAKVIVSYIRLFMAPWGLTAEYYLPASLTSFSLSSGCAIGLLILIILILIKMFRYSRPIFFSILWFFITLLPVCNIVPIVNVMAERYFYIPAMGACMGFSMVICNIFVRRIANDKMRLSSGRRIVRYKYLATFMALLVGVYASLTITRNMDWRDDLTLWSRAVVYSANSPRAHNNLGRAYWESGFIGDARGEFNKAIGLHPGFIPPYVNYSSLCREIGELDEALRVIQLALKVDPGSGEACNNLGNIYERMGLMDDAIKAYKKSLEIIRDDPIVINNLAAVYMRNGMLEESRRALMKALRINPQLPEARHNLGRLYKEKGLLNEAISEYKTAIRVKPTLIEAHHSLAELYAGNGHVREAIGEYMAALKIRPADPESHSGLGGIYLEMGELDKAVKEYREAIEARPDDFKLHNNLGIAYVKKGVLDQAVTCFKDAVGLKGDESNPHCNLGNAYYIQGRIDEAEDELLLAIRYDNDNARAHKGIGLLYMEARNDFEKALFHLERALGLEQDIREKEAVAKLVDKLRRQKGLER